MLRTKRIFDVPLVLSFVLLAGSAAIVFALPAAGRYEKEMHAIRGGDAILIGQCLPIKGTHCNG